MVADDGSDIRARLVKAFDQFHDVTLRGDREVAQLLSDLGVDIAVDLKGHTEQARPWILASRPAPIQVSYFGYTATMGVDFIDYILADRIVLPFDQQEHYSEKIVHIPDCYWVNDSKRQVADELPSRRSVGLPEDGFVFCCFNNSYKLTPQLFDVWMRLLRQVEGSVLWLLQTSDAGVRNLRSEAQRPRRRSGAPGIRAEDGDIPPFGAASPGRPVPRQSAGQCPYGGERCALGRAPVLTCSGHSFIGRVAASLLHAVGLPELVTAQPRRIRGAGASTGAGIAKRLQAIRRRLETNRLTHPLFDTDRLRRHIEAAYGTMCDILQRGEAPRSFTAGVAAQAE